MAASFFHLQGEERKKQEIMHLAVEVFSSKTRRRIYVKLAKQVWAVFRKSSQCKCANEQVMQHPLTLNLLVRI